MPKRIIGSVVFASALALLMFAATVLILSSSTQAAVPATASSSQAHAAQGQAKTAPNGIWEDIAPYPTISVSPTPGTYPMRLKRAAAAAYPPNGKIYQFGGRHGVDGEDTQLQWIWEFTPGNPGTWVRKNALLDSSQPGSRYTVNMAVATLTDTNGVRIYAIGGSSINSEPTAVVRVYDPTADAITTLTSDPWPATPARSPGGYAVYNNKLYIFGGFTSVGNGGVFTDTWQFDPMAAAGSKWTQLNNLNLGRGYTAGAELDGYIYAIGGDTWNTSTHTLVPVNNVERMDVRQPNPGVAERRFAPNRSWGPRCVGLRHRHQLRDNGTHSRRGWRLPRTRCHRLSVQPQHQRLDFLPGSYAKTPGVFMPRPKKSVPTYSHHKPSGQAYVRLPDGAGGRKAVYLGAYNSPESRAEYARLVAELHSAPANTPPLPRAGLTVNEVLLAFLDHAERHYRRPDGTATREVGEFKQVIRAVRRLYGETSAAAFGPRAVSRPSATGSSPPGGAGAVNNQIGPRPAGVRVGRVEELVPEPV